MEFDKIWRIGKTRQTHRLVIRLSYLKEHNDFKNVFSFSFWLGEPQSKLGSYEFFLVKTKGRFPKIYLTNWNKKIKRMEEN